MWVDAEELWGMDLTAQDLLVNVDFQGESLEDHQDLTPHIQEGSNDNGKGNSKADIDEPHGRQEQYEVIDAVHHNRQQQSLVPVEERRIRHTTFFTPLLAKGLSGNMGNLY